MRLSLLTVFGLCLFLSGCGSDSDKPEPPPTVIDAKIVVSSEVNPDVSGRPSPIVMRVFELKSVGNFIDADFYKLFNDYQGALGGDLLATEKFHLQPGDVKPYSHPVDPEARFIAVIAAYRNLNQAVWRDSVAIPAHEKTRIMILLEKLTASIWKK